MVGRSRERYDPAGIRDAPEHHGYARAMGSLTWGTWDHGVRPVEERIRDFVAAYPPDSPARFVGGGEMVRRKDRTHVAATTASRLERLLAKGGRPGSLGELLARYGLAIDSLGEVQLTASPPIAAKGAARQRNVRLRVLHGGVDVEPTDMDEAKASYLETKEKKEAAEQVRNALRRMRKELERPEPDKG
jgi:hypothetical protein